MKVYTAPYTTAAGGLQWGGDYNGGYTTLATFPPSACGADVHVFPCKKAKACQCGKTYRDEPQPPPCTHCGQAHW